MLTMRSDNIFAKWYLSLLAAIYFFICAPWCLYYFYQNFIISGASVPWGIQIACFVAAVSSALYFARPQIGHHGLLLAALLAVFYSVQNYNMAAVVFHTVVIIILCIPLINFLIRYRQFSKQNTLACIVMSAMFAFVLGSALRQGLEITCGCFGSGTTDIITYNTLLRAVIILIFSITAYSYHILPQKA